MSPAGTFHVRNPRSRIRPGGAAFQAAAVLLVAVVLQFVAARPSWALANGVARTPPMGWKRHAGGAVDLHRRGQSAMGPPVAQALRPSLG
jgi:hypothetical protein